MGSISKLGVDIGYLMGGQILWGVVKSTAYPGPGSLTGSYTGVTASATVGAGVGQRFDRWLQPVVYAAAGQR